MAQPVNEFTYNAGDWVKFLGQEDILKKGMATHSSILAWRIQWTEAPGGLWSMESQRVRHNRATFTHLLTRSSSRVHVVHDSAVAVAVGFAVGLGVERRCQ